MIRRVFWTGLGIGLGAAGGILVARQLRRTREALTPSSLGGAVVGALSGLTEVIRDFADEVRIGMEEREFELATALGLDTPGPDPTSGV